MNKKSSIIGLAFNVVLMILGIIMLCAPSTSLGIVMLILGIGLIIYALVLGYLFFKNRSTENPSNIAFPVITLALGIVVIVFNHQLAYILFPLIIGIWALIQGIMNIMEGVSFKKAGLSLWKVSVVLAVAYIAVGLVIVVNMFAFGEVVTVLLGVLFLIFGVIGVVTEGTNLSLAKKIGN